MLLVLLGAPGAGKGTRLCITFCTIRRRRLAGAIRAAANYVNERMIRRRRIACQLWRCSMLRLSMAYLGSKEIAR